MRIKQNYVILCYYSFIIHIITKYFFKDTFNGVESWYDTSNYDKNDG